MMAGRLIGEDPVSPSAHGTSRWGFFVLLGKSSIVPHLFGKQWYQELAHLTFAVNCSNLAMLYLPTVTVEVL